MNDLRAEMHEMDYSELHGEYTRLRYRMQETVWPGNEGRFLALQQELNKRRRADGREPLTHAMYE